MAINLREAYRDQLLLPPSAADWLPEGRLTFPYFIVDVVDELDLAAFYADYREDGRGGGGPDPQIVLGALLYAYCVGERSSRRIERHLSEDVAFRELAVNQQLDHATLARFRRRHAEPIAELFSQVLGLYVNEGLVGASVVSIDGTKLEANASFWSNRTRRQLAEKILVTGVPWPDPPAVRELQYGHAGSAQMKRRRHTPEQIVCKLAEADKLLGLGKSIDDGLQKGLEITDSTYHRWRNQYGGMKADDAKLLKEFERENLRERADRAPIT